MSTIELIVPGIPRPQPRPRVTKTGHAFNPTTEGLKLWKSHLRIAARQQAPREPWAQAVRVDVEAYFPRPQWLLNVLPDKTLPMLERPDRDNLDKTILDTLTGLGYWVDDSQVYVGRLEKWYVQDGYGPGARISIDFLELEPVYAKAVVQHAVSVREAREKRERGGRRGRLGVPEFKFSETDEPFVGDPVKAKNRRPRPVLNGPALINDTCSMEDLAAMMKAGRKVRV